MVTQYSTNDELQKLKYTLRLDQFLRKSGNIIWGLWDYSLYVSYRPKINIYKYKYIKLNNKKNVVPFERK